jgi:nucleotide-binding universal stress UspA family protein
MFTKILVPLDGSERAEAILPYVEYLASRDDNSQVVLLQVIEPSAAIVASGAPRVDQETIDRMYGEARNYLERIQARLEEKGIRGRIHVAFGPVVNTIVDFAAQEKVDLIALASHGRSGVPALFYGSVAAGAVHRADRPLLIVRSNQASWLGETTR